MSEKNNFKNLMKFPKNAENESKSLPLEEIDLKDIGMSVEQNENFHLNNDESSLVQNDLSSINENIIVDDVTIKQTNNNLLSAVEDEIIDDNNKIESVVISKEELNDYINNNESASVDLTFKIENFEGPLDLLLHLIKKSKLGIEEVRLSAITEQYLAIMKQIESVDLEVASDFIEVAATLIEIKSKSLLPKMILEEEEEEDPEALLLQRINEYKLFKETIEKLKPLENVDRFYKKPEPDANKFRVVIKDMQLDMLLNAFTGIIHRVTEIKQTSAPKEVARELFTVSGKISTIKDALLLSSKIKFSELFEKSSSRNEVITTFLALLEMLKLQEIKCVQNDVFNDIEILKAEEING